MGEEQRYRIDKRALRRSFDDAADSYDAAAVLQREVLGRMMERLELVRLRPKAILDLGCGTGESYRRLRARYRGARVVGLDISLGMLRALRRTERLLRRPQLVAADAEALPFVADGFDAVFSNLTLQWVNDLDAALAEMRRVLRPGGLMMFSTLGPDTLIELRQAWARVDPHIHVNAFIDMHDIGDAMVRTGFIDPVLDCERLTMTYGDLSGLIADLKGTGARNMTVGRSRGLAGRSRLRALREAYEPFRGGDGRLPATWEVIHAHAWGGPGPARVSSPGPDGVVRIDLDRLRGRGEYNISNSP